MTRISMVAVVLGSFAWAFLITAGSASAAGLPLIITPDVSTPGDSVTFSGTGCVGPPSDPAARTPQVLVIEHVSGIPVSAPVTPKADGTWSIVFGLPEVVLEDSFTFDAVCDYYSGSFNYLPATLRVFNTLSSSAVPTSSSASNTGSTSAVATTTLTTTGPALAATGSPASSLSTAGVALTLAGAATLLLARRRRGARGH